MKSRKKDPQIVPATKKEIPVFTADTIYNLLIGKNRITNISKYPKLKKAILDVAKIQRWDNDLNFLLACEPLMKEEKKDIIVNDTNASNLYVTLMDIHKNYTPEKINLLETLVPVFQKMWDEIDQIKKNNQKLNKDDLKIKLKEWLDSYHGFYYDVFASIRSNLVNIKLDDFIKSESKKKKSFNFPLWGKSKSSKEEVKVKEKTAQSKHNKSNKFSTLTSATSKEFLKQNKMMVVDEETEELQEKKEKLTQSLTFDDYTMRRK